MNSKLINWKEIYNDPALFHIYLTERKRGKTDCKAWTFLEQITTPNSNVKYANHLYELAERYKVVKDEFFQILDENSDINYNREGYQNNPNYARYQQLEQEKKNLHNKIAGLLSWYYRENGETPEYLKFLGYWNYK